MSEQPIHAKMLIAGTWENGHDRTVIRNPANPNELVGTAARGRAASAERAIAAAKSAQPAWARKRFAERAVILGEALDRFATRAERDEQGYTLVKMAGSWPRRWASYVAYRLRKN
jgi:alpha-ketoglutaric semialdehyde dehydrogenase